MNRARTSSKLQVSATFLVALFAFYVLSYAPVLRYFVPQPTGGFEKPPVVSLWAYRPVEWLIDETPARGPLLWWARIWNADLKFEVFSMWRDIERTFPN